MVVDRSGRCLAVVVAGGGHQWLSLAVGCHRLSVVMLVRDGRCLAAVFIVLWCYLLVVVAASSHH